MRGTGKLDRLDIAILAALQGDGRISNRALAQRVNLSPSACHARTRRLIEAGYVRRFGAEIDLDRVCANVEVHVEVTLEGHRHDEIAKFEKAVLALPEILECTSVGGGHDYVLKVACADVRAYEALSQGLIDGGLGIKQLFSYITIRKVKRFEGYPLARLTGATAGGGD